MKVIQKTLFCRCISPNYLTTMNNITVVKNGGCMLKYCYLEDKCNPIRSLLDNGKVRFFMSDFKMTALNLAGDSISIPPICTVHEECPNIKPFCWLGKMIM